MAPRFAWERLKRSTPQNQLETTDCLGFLEKQPTRIPFDKTNRAGRALTVRRLSGEATNFILETKRKLVRLSRFVIKPIVVM